MTADLDPGAAGDSGATGALGAAAISGTTGTIYDIGYRGYDGPRLGRRYAIAALYLHSLKACFGIGRGGRAKIAPVGLLVLALLPAIVALGIAALTNRAGLGRELRPIRYDNYASFISTVVMLFCAAQAPELLVRDQRYQVLSLYFSRALVRVDYVMAKTAALMTALAILVLLPQALIFVGLVLSDPDVPAAFARNVPFVPPILGDGGAIAVLLGGLGLAIAAFTPRRAYATAAIIGAFILPAVVAGILVDIAPGGPARYIVLFSPPDVLEAAHAWVFGRAATDDTVIRAGLPGQLFMAVVIGAAVACLTLLVRRYQRITA